uniref:C2H2-type domain-containing protein n=2 Tax=Caenorhabditis tropicalis TaxID=1561998 RepID=A0A1I7TWA0_9PELO
MEDQMGIQPKTNEPPPPPPIVICPTEVDHINVTLEKNQQCECKDCGKLFNSVWYLKQHAVKHSNDRPFKCKFCFKTYKFRSNLYQHKCPERQKSMQQRRRGQNIISSTKRNETQTIKVSKIETAIMQEEPQINYQMPVQNCFSELEDNDAPITYGLVIQNIDQNPMQQQLASQQLQMPQVPQIQAPEMQPQPQQQPPPPSMEQNFQSFQMQLPASVDPLMNDMENTFDKQADFDSVRSRQLSKQQIEDFVEKNKQKLFSCRKCRVFLPTEEAYMRHAASHNGEDLFPFKCSSCRQAFDNEKELMRHTATHAMEEGEFRCYGCCGQFRSQYALRRHKDQCRPCFVPPAQGNIMVSVHSPFDPFSFIPDDHLFLPVCDELARAGTDSGVGSEGSPNSMSQASPERHGMEDTYSYMTSQKKKEKEDDEDSGFRSRLNSVTHSCSPDSFSDSHCDSPPRKLSGGGGLGASSFLGGYGTGPAYGQQMIYDKSLDDIECDGYGMIQNTPDMYKQQIISLRNDEVVGHNMLVAPVVQYHLQPMSMKEFCIQTTPSTSDSDSAEIFDNDNGSWKNDGYDMPPVEVFEMKEIAAVMIAMYLCNAATQVSEMLSTLAKLSIQ